MPDLTEARRQALHTAATVVLAFTAGCAGGKVPASGVGGAAPAAAVDAVDAVGADPSATGAAASVEARIAAVRAPFQELCGPQGAMGDCCESLRTACEEAFGVGEAEFNRCLFGPHRDGSRGCTPWGPPVPPAVA